MCTCALDLELMRGIKNAAVTNARVTLANITARILQAGRLFPALAELNEEDPESAVKQVLDAYTVLERRLNESLRTLEALKQIVTVMRRRGSRVPGGGGLVLLPHLIKHLLPQQYYEIRHHEQRTQTQHYTSIQRNFTATQIVTTLNAVRSELKVVKEKLEISETALSRAQREKDDFQGRL
ncbi:hypothetical protein BU23DRAFT_565749 [Bimuria novae-zelandiae CBS 107.79]|uniref:Uncharacterized protein n=1 Tax=Bimuria novae-zelandiae CBS 107.79 TaxID=1447943 RepID=A0A6A5VNU5_9PLEO|nr:hypothetical protein BU23DRAFT_565749 [Bimuria novae-zelandiae CBS 107.79]